MTYLVTLATKKLTYASARVVLLVNADIPKQVESLIYNLKVGLLSGAGLPSRIEH